MWRGVGMTKVSFAAHWTRQSQRLGACFLWFVLLAATVTFLSSFWYPNTHGGDYYGVTVNLASRIADQAVPGEVLTIPEVAAAVPGRAFHPAGRRLLKGFPEPVELLSFS